MDKGMRWGRLAAPALAALAASAGLEATARTYLPGEGNVEVSVYQTTGVRGFRELPTTPFTPHAYTNRPPIEIDAAEERSTYRGLGVSLTDASAWLLAQLSAEKRRAVLEAVFSRERGAALSGIRLNIGASDYSTAIYCYDDTPGDVEMKHFSIDRDRHWLIPMAKEALAVNPEIFFFAAPWSPPAWMKTTNNFIDGHFKDGCEQAMANYLAAYVREMRKSGVPVGAVTVQNEAALSTRGTYPSCIFSEQQESLVCKLLRRRLRAEGSDAQVWLWDWNTNRHVVNGRLARQLADPELLASIDAIAWHSYDAGAEQMWPLKQQYPQLHFYHTEQGPAKHDPRRTQRWWLDRLAMMMENGCETFTGWNLCLTDDGQPLTGPHLCMGLVTVDPETGDFTPSAQYDVFRHVGPFVRQGAKILRPPAFDADECKTLLFRNPDGEYVLVVASDGKGTPRNDTTRRNADGSEPRPKLYLRYGGEMKHLPLPYDTWSLTTVVFRRR
ncbi:MAG: hypothetical protein ACI4RD_05260 [Kiritimatiellia bacterium]